MTFPSAIKKSSQLTISKTGSGSKTSPGSPKSPGSPLKLISSRSSVKASPVIKDSEIANIATSIRKQSVPPKSIPASTKPITKLIIDATKTGTSSVTNEVKKSKTKPPPLKLNIKSTDTNGLQSPTTPKVVPKTPMTPLKTSTKSPMVNKLSSVAKSPLVSTGVVRSSQASNISLSATKSPQVLAGTKTNSSLTAKSSILSSPINKSPKMSVSSKLSVVSSPATQSALTTAVSKTSTMTAMNPKSPQLPFQHSTSTLKSTASKTIIKGNLTSLKSVTLKDRATIEKSTNPGKNVPVLSTNTAEVKLPTTPTNKSLTTSIASNIKLNSFKTTPTTSLSKLLTKESSTAKISSIKAINPNKSSVISKLGSTSPKAMVKKESSTLSLLSVKSSSTVKSTSVVSNSMTSKSNVTPLVTSKNLIPKSPATKTQLLVVTKSTLSSPTVKTSLSPTVKTSLSPTVKTSLSPTVKTSLSPTVKTRSLPLSSAKPPLSPAIKKLVPTKLILSPVKSNNKSFSYSRLSSVSTESLALRTSLKSPTSPKPNKVVPRSPSKIIKKTDESKKLSSFQGEQSVKKTIDIPGIKELSSNLVINEQIESTVTQMSDQNLSNSEKLEVHKMVVNIDKSLETTNNFLNVDIPTNTVNYQNINQSLIQEHHLETIEEDSIEPSLITLQEKQDEDICSSSDFVVVEKDECVPCLNSISQSANNCDIVFDDNHFNSIHENVIVEQLTTVDETQSCIIDIDDHFEPMNDKLVLGDVPFETDISDNDISDSEQAVQKEIIETRNCEVTQENCVDDVFSFSEESLSIINLNRTDSTDDFIHQFMPKSIRRSEGSSSISTDDGSLPSRKSYSEALIGTPKEGEYYFDDMIDDCLDYDYEEEGSVFVEMTEKEFPELKPKDLSVNRRKNKKPKKRNSNRTESQYDSNTSEVIYNPEEFNGSEFCHYIKIMKDCSFYPKGLFSSDSVKLSPSSYSWLDITIRTTKDDLIPSTESLSTYEIFKASNLNKDFLASIIGSTTTIPSNETWFWKSIEGRHQTHNNKTNITLSLKPRPKHLTTPRFMILLALISEAKDYHIQPSLSEHFITSDCMSRFDDKIKRLMVQGLCFIGRLIKDSLSEDDEVNCGNPFGFVDGDIGFWWAGINMLDWQEYIKKCDKNYPTCFQFVIEHNEDGNGYNSSASKSSMNCTKPEDFLSDLDVENFIDTIRNVKYYYKNCFVDSQECIDTANETETSYDNDGSIEWENNSIEH